MNIKPKCKSIIGIYKGSLSYVYPRIPIITYSNIMSSEYIYTLYCKYSVLCDLLTYYINIPIKILYDIDTHVIISVICPK